MERARRRRWRERVHVDVEDGAAGVVRRPLAAAGGGEPELAAGHGPLTQVNVGVPPPHGCSSRCGSGRRSQVGRDGLLGATGSSGQVGSTVALGTRSLKRRTPGWSRHRNRPQEHALELGLVRQQVAAGRAGPAAVGALGAARAWSNRPAQGAGDDGGEALGGDDGQVPAGDDLSDRARVWVDRDDLPGCRGGRQVGQARRMLRRSSASPTGRAEGVSDPASAARRRRRGRGVGLRWATMTS